MEALIIVIALLGALMAVCLISAALIYAFGMAGFFDQPCQPQYLSEHRVVHHAQPPAQPTQEQPKRIAPRAETFVVVDPVIKQRMPAEPQVLIAQSQQGRLPSPIKQLEMK